MFNRYNLVSVNFPLPSKPIKETDNLILNGIRISLDDGLYSEIEEQNYFSLNNNDYTSGRVDIELQFVPLKESYCQFWIGCTSIRTEHGVYKVNPSAGSYNTKHGQECRTKVTYENKMAAGITYFFNSNKDREDFLQSKMFLIEGFIALKKQNNVFGFLCRVEQENDNWIFTEGYTNRLSGKSNIRCSVH